MMPVNDTVTCPWSMALPSMIGVHRGIPMRAVTAAAIAAPHLRVALACADTSLRGDVGHLIRWRPPTPSTPLANGVLGSVQGISRH